MEYIRNSTQLNTQLNSQVKKAYMVLGALLLSSITIAQMELDDHLYNLYLEKTAGTTHQSQAIRLPEYTLIQQRELSSVKYNASGITWNPQTKTLFIVLNGPNEIVELSRDGEVLRHIPLIGFNDVEGITWVGKDNFVVVEERHQSLVAVRVESDTTTIQRTGNPSFTVGIDSGTNKGFEGIAWDPESNAIYIAKERDPARLMRIQGFHPGKVTDISVQQDDAFDKAARLYKDDFSGLHYDPATRNLLVLSDESKLLTEINKEGKAVSFLELAEGWHGLKQDIPQAEGVTMDDDGNLYLISEPNYFYKFSKPS